MQTSRNILECSTLLHLQRLDYYLRKVDWLECSHSPVGRGLPVVPSLVQWLSHKSLCGLCTKGEVGVFKAGFDYMHLSSNTSFSTDLTASQLLQLVVGRSGSFSDRGLLEPSHARR